MDFLVRAAKQEDVAAIVTLHAAATKLMHQLSPDGFGEALALPLDVAEEVESFSEALDDKETIILVAEKGGKVAGFTMGVIEHHPDDLLSAPYLTVQYICVAEEFRGMGIGKALMTEVEDWAEGNGLCALELTVWSNNEPAKALFRSLGYVSLEVRMAKKATRSAW